MKINKNFLATIALLTAFSFSPTQANTMLGAFIKHDGWSTDDIDKFNTDTHKSMAVTTLFSTFDMHWDSLNIQASNIVSRGATPMITLMPYSTRHPNMLQAIISGQEDLYINSWIQSFKAWRDSYSDSERPTILLRFAHEFNGNWYPWGNNPENLKAAWRHIHSLFEMSGVNNSVEWVWCASATDVDDYNDLTLYYPGDDVVDWTSLDGYNWGTNYAWTTWRSFDEVFSSAYVTLVNNFPDKPVILAEVGSAEPHDLPDIKWGQNGDDSDANESKETWVADMLQRIATDYPAIRAISWFNINKELGWALNETTRTGQENTGLDSYNQMVMSEHYKSTFTPLKTTETDTAGDDTSTTKDGATRPGKGKPDKRGRGSGGKGKKNTRATTTMAETAESPEAVKMTGLQRALAVSRMPAVVGQKLLAREANGFRNMPDKVLKKIRQNRLNSGQP